MSAELLHIMNVHRTKTKFAHMEDEQEVGGRKWNNKSASHHIAVNQTVNRKIRVDEDMPWMNVECCQNLERLSSGVQ